MHIIYSDYLLANVEDMYQKGGIMSNSLAW